MRWSKVRKLVEDSFAPSVRGRIRLFSTHYACSCGYGSIVADGIQIAEFNTDRHFQHVTWVSDEDRPGWARKVVAPITDSERCQHAITVPREFERADLHKAGWQLIHTNPHSALADEDPLLMTLAVLHAKVGVSRVRALRDKEIHPLVRWAVEFRLAAESELRAAAKDRDPVSSEARTATPGTA
jgi:hypothetical protein